MSHEILPVSHCKYCKEEAQDCECSRGKRQPWQISGEDPWDEMKCDHAQRLLLDFIINKIEECKEPVTLSALKSMRSKIEGCE